MLSVAQAQEKVSQHVQPLPPCIAPLASTALGLILAEDVRSDIEMPPFDKALMDGFAVRSTDVRDGGVELLVVEEVSAGNVPKHAIQAGQATSIMTGAPIPDGADAVVMVENTSPLDGDRVRINEIPEAGQNILVRASEINKGDVIVPKGSRLRPQEFGMLATLGKTALQVHPAPLVALLSTGDEIVDCFMMPGPGQIRNSNATMLLAQVCRAGGVPKSLGIGHDNLEHLTPLVKEGLQANVLILSGGVSAGKKDLVPGVLADLGVKAIFHKVNMKPGKPVFFGVLRRDDKPATLVFGLPGNPVSSLACFELFVRPALSGLMGMSNVGPFMVQAKLTEDFAYRTSRPTYYPVRLTPGDEGWRVTPVEWFGSANLRALLDANALALFPEGDHQHKAGQMVPVVAMEQ